MDEVRGVNLLKIGGIRGYFQILNRYIKKILKDLSETVPSLKEKVPTKLTMKQKEAMRRDKIEPDPDLNGNVIVPCYDCATPPDAQALRIFT